MPASSKVACGSAPAAEQARTSEEVQERPARRFGSMVPLSAGHAYAAARARRRLGKARTHVKSGVEGMPWKHGPPARYTSARAEVTAF